MHPEIDYPDVERDLNRWLPLVKWFLAIPHYIVLAFLILGAILAILIAWIAILFNRSLPAYTIRLRGRGGPMVAPLTGIWPFHW